MKGIIVRALWACADVLEVVRDGCVVLAVALIGGVES